MVVVGHKVRSEKTMGLNVRLRFTGERGSGRIWRMNIEEGWALALS